MSAEEPHPPFPAFLPSLQEPEEKRVVQELLETEQAYVARLHLLDQASGHTPSPALGPPALPPAHALRVGLGAPGLVEEASAMEVAG